MSRPDDTKTEAEGGFLGRWAKRKQAVQREVNAPSPVDPTTIKQPVVNSASAEAGETPPIPSLDDILPGSDVSAFFQKHVPEALRAAALRKVWMTDPDIRDFIEMADYQLDYANPDSIPGWSSSIEGVDLKGMVDRIFNSVPDAKAETPAMTPELRQVTGEPDNEIEELPGGRSTLVESTDAIHSGETHTDVIQNGALQNKHEESVVYETPRKRHGGALPS